MSLTVLSNIASLRAQRQLSLTTNNLSRTQERLASGLRINNASDDAAGLAISSTLNAQSRLATVAIRNANDGISAISIADGALSEIVNVLQRMSELAEQSANGVYTNSQRSPLQGEFSALASEIERIAVTTQFNKISLLSGGNSIALQVGFTAQNSSQITIQNVQGTLSSIKLAALNESALSYSITGNTEANAQLAARTALDAVTAAINLVASSRGSLGAAESRLSSAVQNLETSKTNFTAAESRIRDVDVAEEVANLLRLQILQQTGIAVLAQANLQPSLVQRLINPSAS